jgi:hypothetical protein
MQGKQRGDGTGTSVTGTKSGEKKVSGKKPSSTVHTVNQKPQTKEPTQERRHGGGGKH